MAELRQRARAVVKTVCSGTHHRVALVGKRLVLLDHPADLAKMEAYTKLGGTGCGCIRILRNWRERNLEHLPTQLRKLRPQPRVQRRSLFEGGMAAEEFDRLFEIVTREIAKHYRFSSAKTFSTRHTLVLGIVEPAKFELAPHEVLLHERAWKRFGGRRKRVFTVVVPADWLDTIHAAGLMTVPDQKDIPRLIIARAADDRFVWALRQGPGFRLRPRLALIIERHGRRQLKWASARCHEPQTLEYS